MDEAKLTMRKAIVMLGHRNSLIYRKNRLKDAMDVHRKQIIQLKETLKTDERTNSDIDSEIFNVNNVLAAIFEKVPNMRSIEFMDVLYNSDQYTEMDTELSVGDIMADFEFNGRV